MSCLKIKFFLINDLPKYYFGKIFFFIVLNEIIYAVSRDMQFVRTLQVIIDQILGHACKTA